MHFGLDFDLARFRLSQDNSGSGWAKSAQVHVELSLGPSRIESIWAEVEPSHFGQKSSRVNLGPSRAKWSILSRPESVGTDIEPSWPMPMSSWTVQAHVEMSLSGSILSRAGSGRYLDDWVRVDVEPSGPRPILSRAGLSWCRVEQARANVESSGPGRWRAKLAQVHVESSGPEPMSSRPSPGWCRFCWSRVIKSFEESKSKVFDERLVLLLCVGGIWVD